MKKHLFTGMLAFACASMPVYAMPLAVDSSATAEVKNTLTSFMEFLSKGKVRYSFQSDFPDTSDTKDKKKELKFSGEFDLSTQLANTSTGFKIFPNGFALLQKNISYQDGTKNIDEQGEMIFLVHLHEGLIYTDVIYVKQNEGSEKFDKLSAQDIEKVRHWQWKLVNSETGFKFEQMTTQSTRAHFTFTKNQNGYGMNGEISGEKVHGEITRMQIANLKDRQRYFILQEYFNKGNSSDILWQFGRFSEFNGFGFNKLGKTTKPIKCACLWDEALENYDVSITFDNRVYTGLITADAPNTSSVFTLEHEESGKTITVDIHLTKKNSGNSISVMKIEKNGETTYIYR